MYGFDRSVSGKTVWAQRKNSQQKNTNTLDKSNERDIIKAKASNSYRYPASQQRIDQLIQDDMSNIKFTCKPVYNPRIRRNGMTTIVEDKNTGKVKRIEKIEIGKQDKSSAEFLEDTIIHEELEARIAIRSRYSAKYRKLYYECSDVERHTYIDSIIKRYFRMRGWWCDDEY